MEKYSILNNKGVYVRNPYLVDREQLKKVQEEEGENYYVYGGADGCIHLFPKNPIPSFHVWEAEQKLKIHD
jgi:hypothetical protein